MPLKKSWLNFRNDYPGMMSPGMVFTVEPAVSEGTSSLQILRDGWTAVTKDNSRSAQFEHTILITGKNFILIKMQIFFCRINTYPLYNTKSCPWFRLEEYGIVGNMNFLAAIQYWRMIFLVKIHHTIENSVYNVHSLLAYRQCLLAHQVLW